MADPVNMYGIFDVNDVQKRTITFLRYQVEPQGNRIYKTLSGDLVHEICIDKNYIELYHVPGENVYSMFFNGDYPHGPVAGSNPLQPGNESTNYALRPIPVYGAPGPKEVVGEQNFTIRLVGAPPGAHKLYTLNEDYGYQPGRNNGWKGDYFVYEKPSPTSYWDVNGEGDYIAYVGSDYRSNPYRHGIALIDVRVIRLIDDGPGNQLAYQFNYPHFINERRENLEWSPQIERYKLIEMIEPYITI